MRYFIEVRNYITADEVDYINTDTLARGECYISARAGGAGGFAIAGHVHLADIAPAMFADWRNGEAEKGE